MSRVSIRITTFFVLAWASVSSMSGWSGRCLAEEPAANSDAVSQLAARIDELIAARWEADEVKPAPPADDAEYLRRTYLNLVGKIPPVSEVRRFLADTSPDKRRQLVDRLLESPAFITNMTNFYRALLLPEPESDIQLRFLVPAFEAWLRDNLIEETGYDGMVRELLTYPLTNTGQNTGPSAFYRAKDAKPENLAAGTTRLFLGVRLECAQCHNHPFAKWRQEDFWSVAAFFAGVGGARTGQLSENASLKEIKIPDTETVVPARFLEGEEPEWTEGSLARNVLADWMTSPENPYFARAAANRIWANMMGVGIVEPVDDFDESNPPSHPELLNELARSFAAHDFDIKLLIRAIAASNVYQLTSRLTDPSQKDSRLFARMAVKGLTPEQLFDSLASATGYYDGAEAVNNQQFFFGGNSPRAMVQELFSNSSSTAVESQTTILQALAMMNGQFVVSATHPQQSTTLAAVIESPFLDTAGRVETLYLAALSRMPTEQEKTEMLSYVDSGGAAAEKKPSIGEVITALLPGGDKKSLSQKDLALGDVFWALLNSSEFLLNH